MSVEFRTLQPEEFYRQHLSVGERPDGRGLLERRPVTVSAQSGHIATADGSAVVKCGDTTIVCGIRAELTSPRPDQPDHGFIVPNFTFSSSALASSISGLGLHFNQRVSQFLLTVLRSSECIQMTDLNILAGQYVWVLYLDLMCLDYSGNMLDTCVTAMMSALNNVTLPLVDIDTETNEVKVNISERKKLKLQNKPSCSTVVLFANTENTSEPYLLSDPTEEEEALSCSQISVVTVDNDICHILQSGSDSITPQLLQQSVDLALKRSKVVSDKVL